MFWNKSNLKEAPVAAPIIKRGGPEVSSRVNASNFTSILRKTSERFSDSERARLGLISQIESEKRATEFIRKVIGEYMDLKRENNASGPAGVGAFGPGRTFTANKVTEAQMISTIQGILLENIMAFDKITTSETEMLETVLRLKGDCFRALQKLESTAGRQTSGVLVGAPGGMSEQDRAFIFKAMEENREEFHRVATSVLQKFDSRNAEVDSFLRQQVPLLVLEAGKEAALLHSNSGEMKVGGELSTNALKQIENSITALLNDKLSQFFTLHNSVTAVIGNHHTIMEKALKSVRKGITGLQEGQVELLKTTKEGQEQLNSVAKAIQTSQIAIIENFFQETKNLASQNASLTRDVNSALERLGISVAQVKALTSEKLNALSERAGLVEIALGKVNTTTAGSFEALGQRMGLQDVALSTLMKTTAETKAFTEGRLETLGQRMGMQDVSLGNLLKSQETTGKHLQGLKTDYQMLDSRINSALEETNVKLSGLETQITQGVSALSSRLDNQNVNLNNLILEEQKKAAADKLLWASANEELNRRRKDDDAGAVAVRTKVQEMETIMVKFLSMEETLNKIAESQREKIAVDNTPIIQGLAEKFHFLCSSEIKKIQVSSGENNETLRNSVLTMAAGLAALRTKLEAHTEYVANAKAQQIEFDNKLEAIIRSPAPTLDKKTVEDVVGEQVKKVLESSKTYFENLERVYRTTAKEELKLIRAEAQNDVTATKVDELKGRLAFYDSELKKTKEEVIKSRDEVKLLTEQKNEAELTLQKRVGIVRLEKTRQLTDLRNSTRREIDELNRQLREKSSQQVDVENRIKLLEAELKTQFRDRKDLEVRLEEARQKNVQEGDLRTQLEASNSSILGITRTMEELKRENLSLKTAVSEDVASFRKETMELLTKQGEEFKEGLALEKQDRSRLFEEIDKDLKARQEQLNAQNTTIQSLGNIRSVERKNRELLEQQIEVQKEGNAKLVATVSADIRKDVALSHQLLQDSFQQLQMVVRNQAVQERKNAYIETLHSIGMRYTQLREYLGDIDANNPPEVGMLYNFGKIAIGFSRVFSKLINFAQFTLTPEFVQTYTEVQARREALETKLSETEIDTAEFKAVTIDLAIHMYYAVLPAQQAYIAYAQTHVIQGGETVIPHAKEAFLRLQEYNIQMFEQTQEVQETLQDLLNTSIDSVRAEMTEKRTEEIRATVVEDCKEQVRVISAFQPTETVELVKEVVTELAEVGTITRENFEAIQNANQQVGNILELAAGTIPGFKESYSEKIAAKTAERAIQRFEAQNYWVTEYGVVTDYGVFEEMPGDEKRPGKQKLRRPKTTEDRRIADEKEAKRKFDERNKSQEYVKNRIQQLLNNPVEFKQFYERIRRVTQGSPILTKILNSYYTPNSAIIYRDVEIQEEKGFGEDRPMSLVVPTPRIPSSAGKKRQHGGSMGFSRNQVRKMFADQYIVNRVKNLYK